MQQIKANDDVINNLNFSLKTYDAITKTVVMTKNRLAHMNSEEKPGNNQFIKNMESLQGQLTRATLRELEYWPIWTEWLKGVPGIGPGIAGNLILLYYYRFIAVCKDCGSDVIKKESEPKKNKNGKAPVIKLDENGEEKKVMTFFCPTCNKSIKGEGVLKHRIDKTTKDFSNVSKWWAYLGQSVVDGKMPKRQTGVVSNWSAKGRQTAYMIGISFEHQKDTSGNPYREFYDATKKKLQAVYPEKTDGHRRDMSKMRTAKFFLSHFWHVARELEDKSTRGIYSDVILAHTGIIPPYYWKNDVHVPVIEEEAPVVETKRRIAAAKKAAKLLAASKV